jgi:hypothetical protein
MVDKYDFRNRFRKIIEPSHVSWVSVIQPSNKIFLSILGNDINVVRDRNGRVFFEILHGLIRMLSQIVDYLVPINSNEAPEISLFRVLAMLSVYIEEPAGKH